MSVSGRVNISLPWARRSSFVVKGIRRISERRPEVGGGNARFLQAPAIKGAEGGALHGLPQAAQLQLLHRRRIQGFKVGIPIHSTSPDGFAGETRLRRFYAVAARLSRAGEKSTGRKTNLSIDPGKGRFCRPFRLRSLISQAESLCHLDCRIGGNTQTSRLRREAAKVNLMRNGWAAPAYVDRALNRGTQQRVRPLTRKG